MTAASNIVEWTTLGRCIKNQYKLDCRTLIKWAEGNDCGGGGRQGGPLLLVYSLVGWSERDAPSFIDGTCGNLVADSPKLWNSNCEQSTTLFAFSVPPCCCCCFWVCLVIWAGKVLVMENGSKSKLMNKGSVPGDLLRYKREGSSSASRGHVPFQRQQRTLVCKWLSRFVLKLPIQRRRWWFRFGGGEWD